MRGRGRCLRSLVNNKVGTFKYEGVCIFLANLTKGIIQIQTIILSKLNPHLYATLCQTIIINKLTVNAQMIFKISRLYNAEITLKNTVGR